MYLPIRTTVAANSNMFNGHSVYKLFFQMEWWLDWLSDEAPCYLRSESEHVER